MTLRAKLGRILLMMALLVALAGGAHLTRDLGTGAAQQQSTSTSVQAHEPRSSDFAGVRASFTCTRAPIGLGGRILRCGDRSFF